MCLIRQHFTASNCKFHSTLFAFWCLKLGYNDEKITFNISIINFSNLFCNSAWYNCFFFVCFKLKINFNGNCCLAYFFVVILPALSICKHIRVWAFCRKLVVDPFSCTLLYASFISSSVQCCKIDNKIPINKFWIVIVTTEFQTKFLLNWTCNISTIECRTLMRNFELHNVNVSPPSNIDTCQLWYIHQSIANAFDIFRIAFQFDIYISGNVISMEISKSLTIGSYFKSHSIVSND